MTVAMQLVNNVLHSYANQMSWERQWPEQYVASIWPGEAQTRFPQEDKIPVVYKNAIANI